jgi:hypothetical protein
MLRLVAKRRSGKVARFSDAKSLPAPVGGWNARDGLPAMKETDAVVLKNWYPRTTDVTIRGGAANHKTGFSATIETLAVYNSLTGSNKMFAAAGTGIYDATTAGTVGASVATITNARWQWVNFGIATNHYLIMVNGVDKPLYYDGSTWTAIDGSSSPSITGVTTTNLIHVCVFKRRLIFVEKSKMSFWYLPVDVVGGAAAEFRLNNVAPRGGYLMACATWTRDGGSGPDDVFVAITSEGELIVFAGTDPATSSSWLHVGTYFYGRPLGRRCFEKLGGDLILLTERGAFPLSSTLNVSESERTRLALTSKIEKAFNETAQTQFSSFGWQPLAFHTQGAMVFNVPTGSSTFEQYVVNLLTKSWCQFTSWNAYCFAVLNGELYMGLSDKVAKAWTGHSDFGNNISADALQAFSTLGTVGRPKHVKNLRYYLAADGGFTYQYGIAVDFDATATLSESNYSVSSSSVWDTAVWDTAVWGASAEIKREWRGATTWPGFFIAIALRVSNNAIEGKWIATDVAFELGDGL